MGVEHLKRQRSGRPKGSKSSPPWVRRSLGPQEPGQSGRRASVTPGRAHCSLMRTNVLTSLCFSLTSCMQGTRKQTTGTGAQAPPPEPDFLLTEAQGSEQSDASSWPTSPFLIYCRACRFRRPDATDGNPRPACPRASSRPSSYPMKALSRCSSVVA